MSSSGHIYIPSTKEPIPTGLTTSEVNDLIDAKIGTITPIPITTGTLEFYGDSITAGQGASSSTLNYASLLCQQYGLTQSNWAVSGSVAMDCIFQVMSKHNTNYDSILNVGFNDIRWTGNPDQQFAQVRESYLTALFHLAIPSTARVDSRLASRTGSWVNTPFSFGLVATGTNGTLSQTLTGRYVGFVIGCNVVADTVVSFTIDGVSVASNLTIRKPPQASGMGYDGHYRTFIYDTQSSASHNVVLTIHNSGTALACYFLGFDPGLVSRTVLAVSPDAYDYSYDTASPWNGGTVARLVVMKEIQRLCCKHLRDAYGLKTYWVDASNNQVAGSRHSDGTHPNDQGHSYIADRISYVMQNGEY